MSDRTNVNLSIRLDDFTKHPSLFEGFEISKSVSNTMISLDYCDINNADLEIEATMQSLRIPYDKTWENGKGFACGSEYCRVLDNGCVSVKKLTGDDQRSVNLDEVINAYKTGDIQAYFQQKIDDLYIIDWEQQEYILQARLLTQMHLLSLKDHQLNKIANEQVNTINGKLIEKWLVKDEEPLISHLDNEGKITFILNSGYLSEGVPRYNFGSPKLFKSSKELVDCETFQFIKLIMSINDCFAINGEEYIELKEQMNMDDREINALFVKAKTRFTQFNILLEPNKDLFY